MPRISSRPFIKGFAIMAISSTAASANGLSIVNPPSLFDPSGFGYSQAVIAPPSGQTVFISGQGGADSTGALAPEFEVQVKQAFSNLRAALQGAGAELSDVAKLTIFVVDHEPAKLGVITKEVVQMFGTALPAQSLIPVPRLALDGMLFEVEAIAVTRR
jgi:enamine deaminase RidA (YjgF/YER057c/UK114 family)